MLDLAEEWPTSSAVESLRIVLVTFVVLVIWIWIWIWNNFLHSVPFPHIYNNYYHIQILMVIYMFGIPFPVICSLSFCLDLSNTS